MIKVASTKSLRVGNQARLCIRTKAVKLLINVVN